MNGATEWLPVVVSLLSLLHFLLYNTKVLKGVDGAFALIAASKYEGIKIFQYDGWRFTEIEMQYNSGSFSAGVVSMYSTIVYGKPVLGKRNL